MTTTEDARRRLDEGQAQLDEVTADLARFDELLTWLPQALERGRALNERYLESESDLTAVLEADPAAVTPPFANEDSVWEALAELDDRVRLLLRIVADELTTGGC